MEGYVEYGYVNTVNAANGTVTVIQPDKGGYISGEIPFFRTAENSSFRKQELW